VLLEAFFNRPDMPFHGIVLGQGDRFLETYYSDRWYNIFEIHDREDDRLKGWYCNIGCPAEIGEDTISYIDLALDLLVFPDGRQIVLDEEEFARLDLPPSVQEKSKASLHELQDLFREKVQG
jgi:protein associated with RNAse G/E